MRVGFIGWRGMVGSVLLQRMTAENDFNDLECAFFSTSNAGGSAPDIGHGPGSLLDANDLDALADQEVLITCQGGDYTQAIFPALRQQGWRGVWIDAASTLRMEDDAVLVLDPVNGDAIRQALVDGKSTFIGANCTVSLMLMGLAGLIRTGQVEWISSMTYQAASGAGARGMRELVQQMRQIGVESAHLLNDPATAALTLDAQVSQTLRGDSLSTDQWGAALAGSALPWIDRLVDDGQTREEWKAMVEANKILGLSTPLPVDGLCVRIGAMRCHAQALTIKLRSHIAMDEVTTLINDAHEWTRVVPNTQADSVTHLTPAAVAGSLNVPVGRLRKMKLGPNFITAFTVGDQLLWGAAEPLRRMLRILREHKG